MKVIWSLKSVNTYDQIVSFLLTEWGQTPANKFMDEVDKVLVLISKNPKMFRRSLKLRNVRIGYITQHNSLIYRIKNKTIELILFWDNRQNPGKLKY
ncbi:MAG: type II toxin-antitoxin system RelE/ParE family toxin [Prolixibacteraceae bacterium]|nr:type II toxin-antitoxin system RelE/ParE family toxin [Prolixibacteraceae bacterium]